MREKEKSKRYEKITHLGEGQFAHVYKAKDLETGDIVAIKKIKLGSRAEALDGVNRTALREIKLLQELHHDNIIRLRDVICHDRNIQLVMDFMETDLEHIVTDNLITLLPSHVKNISLQTLLGLEFLHANWVLHRDLKPNNLLMSAAGRIKIADFGLARFYGEPDRDLSPQVVTRWYRAPELLFAACDYAGGVDMWAIGCILAELLLRRPLFPGESDFDQLSKIVKLLGTPQQSDWPEMTKLPQYVRMGQFPALDLKSIFSAVDDETIFLLKGCLTYNPVRRWTASQALRSLYFQVEPHPCRDEDLPLPSSVNTGVVKRCRFNLDDESGPQAMRRKLNFDE